MIGLVVVSATAVTGAVFIRSHSHGCITFLASSSMGQDNGCDVSVGLLQAFADCTTATSVPSSISIWVSHDAMSNHLGDAHIVDHHCRLTIQPGDEGEVFGNTGYTYETTVLADFTGPVISGSVDYLLSTECLDNDPCAYAAVFGDGRSIVVGEGDHHVGPPMPDTTSITDALNPNGANRLLVRWSHGRVIAWLNGIKLGEVALKHGAEQGWPNFGSANQTGAPVNLDLDRFAVFAST